MVVAFLISLVVTLLAGFLTVMLSGTYVSALVNPVEIAGVIVIFALLVFLSGYGRPFCRLFSSRKKMGSYAFGELRDSEQSLLVAMRVALYVCMFFSVIGGMYFYMNFWSTQTVGPNLATVILSLYYLCFLIHLLLVLKAGVHRAVVLCMAEEECPSPKNARPSSWQVARSVLVALAAIAVTAALVALVVASSTANEQPGFNNGATWWIDAPSFIIIVAESLVLLAVSGNFISFWNGVGAVLTGRPLSVCERGIFSAAVQSFRCMVLVSGTKLSLVGFVGILTNLENSDALGASMFVSLLGFLYAVVLCAVLVLVESKVLRLCRE